jgi:hypothetical protein
MKRSIVERKGIETEELELIDRLITLIPHNERRSAMGDVTRTLLLTIRSIFPKVHEMMAKYFHLP